MTAGVIDPDAFNELQEAAGDDFVAELIDTFLDEAPGMFAALRGSLASGDADGFRRAAHSLKSNSNTFGAFAMGALARDIELGGLGTDPARDVAAIDRLAGSYDDAATALRALRDG